MKVRKAHYTMDTAAHCACMQNFQRGHKVATKKLGEESF